MRLPLREFTFAIGLSLAAAATGGCKVTKDDIDSWKGTVKGPGKMVAVMLAEKYEPELRGRAALALVEMERHDIDGVAELMNALQRVDSKTREQLITQLTPGLVELMNAPDPAADANQGPPPRQIRAKDAAFVLVPHASAESRKALTDAVMRWYTVDFNGRSLSGNYSAEQVVRQLGSAGASTLVEALAARLPQQALVKLAELIGQLGDPGTKKRAAQKLVAIEQEMYGAPFVAWLKGQIVQQLGEDAAAKDQARIEKAALLNRDKFIDEGAIPAMKHLADQPEVTARLLAIASDKDPAQTDRRTRALQALEGKVSDEHLDALLALALDPGSPPAVRDYAFDRVGDVRSPKAIAPMWPLVQDAKNQRVRWRAGELVLAIGGTAVLSEFFAKLPEGSGVDYEPEELQGYALRMGQMNPLPTAIAGAQLGSPDWWDRVIALYFFERKGVEADAALITRLLGDTAAVEGKNWGPGMTVGKVAKQALDGLRERLGHTADGTANSG